MFLEQTDEEKLFMVEKAMEYILKNLKEKDKLSEFAYPKEVTNLAFEKFLQLEAPQNSSKLEEIYKELFDSMDFSYNITHPGYISFIPSGGLFPTSELIWCSMNRYTGYVFGCPGLVSLNSNVLIWFCKIIGYSENSFGFYTEGATSATMNAICLARNEKVKDQFY
jgi:aromatic-L-amino-acid/L-tryptophan decarboxylase